MQKTNILYLTTAFVVGGAEKIVLDLMLNLDQERFNTSVIALGKNTDTLETFLSHHLRAKKLDMPKGLKVWSRTNAIGAFSRAFSYLDRYVVEYKIDIIHVHLFHSLPLASLLKLKHSHLKIIFTPHNTDIGGNLREVLTYLLKPLRNVDIVFSKSMITMMHKKETAVIVNGIDIEKFQPPIEKKSLYTFISVGTVRAQKNQVFLVDCAKQLKAKGYRFVIDIVGGGEENTQLINTIQQEIIRQDVVDCIRILGVRSDIPDLLKSAHCMVLPSHYEGLPLVLLEAGAAKLPVISTPVGAIPTVLDESNGYLSTLEHFCDTMEAVMMQQEEANKKAEVLAQKISQQYSIKSMVQAHDELYQSLMK